MKWSQTGLPPDEAKLVEQMQLTPSMICRIFGVPPHMVADLTRSTNNNIEEQGIEFVRSALRPWAERGESEADVKLFGRNNQARLVTVIDLSERERGDTAAQTNHVERMIFTGVYSLNEGRRYLGLQGIGPEGDQRFIQSAMIPIDQAGKQNPAPDANPPEDSTDEQTSEAPTQDELAERISRLQAGSMGLITDACRRILLKEEAVSHLTGEPFTQWRFKHRVYCQELLLPMAKLFSECVGANGVETEVAVALFLDRHFEYPPGTPESKAAELRSYLLAAAAAKGAA
jgi:hypothetical protein